MSQRYQGGFITASYNGLKVPDAPTIGTATGGSGSASVTFTAPSDVGGGAITSYTAVSTPGGFTGTAASSPVTVSGLTGGTAYTFKVFATNAYGPSSLSSASNSATPSLVVGQAFGGGYFAGQISTSANGVATHNLIVADKTTGSTYGKKWGPSGTGVYTTSRIDGPTNSAVLAALGSTYEAATFCENLNSGGYTDWYLPALDELAVCYYFLKPGTTSNSTGSGSNAYAVSPQPISTNYTSGSPAQTSATNFRTGASAQEFEPGTLAPDLGGHWTSTEGPNIFGNFAWDQEFINGLQTNTTDKTIITEYTRAIRRIAV